MVDVQRAGVENRAAAIGVGACQAQGANVSLGQAVGVASVVNDPAHGQNIVFVAYRETFPQRHGARAEVQFLCAPEGEVPIPVLRVVVGIHNRGIRAVVNCAAVDRQSTRAEGLGVVDVQRAGVEYRAALVSVGARQRYSANARLRQAVGVGAVGNDPAHDQGAVSVFCAYDTIAPQRHGAGAKIQVVAAVKGEVPVPTLRVVVGIHNRGARTIANPPAVDSQDARADSAGVIDAQRAGVEDRTATVGVRAGQHQCAGSVLG